MSSFTSNEIAGFVRANKQTTKNFKYQQKQQHSEARQLRRKQKKIKHFKPKNDVNAHPGTTTVEPDKTRKENEVSPGVEIVPPTESIQNVPLQPLHFEIIENFEEEAMNELNEKIKTKNLPLETALQELEFWKQSVHALGAPTENNFYALGMAKRKVIELSDSIEFLKRDASTKEEVSPVKNLENNKNEKTEKRKEPEQNNDPEITSNQANEDNQLLSDSLAKEILDRDQKIDQECEMCIALLASAQAYSITYSHYRVFDHYEVAQLQLDRLSEHMRALHSVTPRPREIDEVKGDMESSMSKQEAHNLAEIMVNVDRQPSEGKFEEIEMTESSVKETLLTVPDITAAKEVEAFTQENRFAKGVKIIKNFIQSRLFKKYHHKLSEISVDTSSLDPQEELGK